MNLDKIKEEKTKEAEDFYLKIGLDPQKDVTIPSYNNEYWTSHPILKEEPNQKSKLIWTRLSNNSNIGSIVE